MDFSHLARLSLDNETWAIIAFIVVQTLALFAAGHAILYKRDPQASASWAGLILLAPGIGIILYWLLGINRTRAKAIKIYRPTNLTPVKKLETYSTGAQNIKALGQLISQVSRASTLREGNMIRPLIDGEQAFPEMIKAIKKAKSTIALSTYIFDNDDIGNSIAKELKNAANRGVTTKVLIDGVGARYSFPTIFKKLKAQNLKAKRFHSVLWPWRFHYAQLRNHRKLLIIDGELGFFGGMNIRDGHMVKTAKEKDKTKDLHFKLKGPILKDLHDIFANDWYLANKERLPKDKWKIDLNPHGNATARVLPNGPHEKFDQLRWTLLGAISCAQSSIAILTPYFLPDETLISALSTASLRGVAVDIVIPEKNNHALVHWACLGNISQVLVSGCKVWLEKAPFDHSKLMIIDDSWCLIGSSNWDARSFRLNFELNIDSNDAQLCQEMIKIFQCKKKDAIALKLEYLHSLSFPIRFRNAFARLLGPYL
ncbi:MAG: cardiolipin synthase [Bacteriovoracaceae bacterium]|nr:cardiolipin synthase [Bacteriovoracaceae bacterium]